MCVFIKKEIIIIMKVKVRTIMHTTYTKQNTKYKKSNKNRFKIKML